MSHVLNTKADLEIDSNETEVVVAIPISHNETQHDGSSTRPVQSGTQNGLSIIRPGRDKKYRKKSYKSVNSKYACFSFCSIYAFSSFFASISIFSIFACNSMFGIMSLNSVLSIASVNCLGSIGSVNSVLSIFSNNCRGCLFNVPFTTASNSCRRVDLDHDLDRVSKADKDIIFSLYDQPYSIVPANSEGLSETDLTRDCCLYIHSSQARQAGINAFALNANKTGCIAISSDKNVPGFPTPDNDGLTITKSDIAKMEAVFFAYSL